MRDKSSIWFLYLLRCRDGELYVGITNDIKDRLQRHSSGTACRYTRYRRPVELLYFEQCGDYETARKREQVVKRFSREKKLALLERPNLPESPRD